MKNRIFAICAIAGCLVTAAQTPSIDHLTPTEIAAAEASPPDIGVVSIHHSYLPFTCQTQGPSESIYTPTGWLSTMSRQAKKQYLPYNPTPDETSRVLTIISRGCVGGDQSGPYCDSITRAALLSDKTGTVVVEAISQQPLTQSWRNAYGATSSCTFLISRFPLADVKKVQNAKGEFMIATFNGTAPARVYTVEEKYIKKLGL